MTAVYQSDLPEVVGMEWEEFLEHMRQNWHPGQHMALVGPTGSGKSVLVTALLKLRKYVIVLDAKGGDSTLKNLLKLGFQPSSWPPSKEVRKDIEDGKMARLLIGSEVRHAHELPKLRNEIGRALLDAFNERGWTVYVDELQIVADRRLMNLGASVERNLIAARDRKVTMVMSFQRPANVPRSASEMSTWFIVLYTRDRDTVERLAEMAGRSSAEIRGMVKGLPEFCVLVFSRNPRSPVIVTKANPI